MNNFPVIPDTTFPQQSLVLPAVTYSPSLFSGHLLKPNSDPVRHAEKLHPDWITGLLIACFILGAWTRHFYHRRLQQIMRAPLSKRFLNQLTRDGNLFKERVSIAGSIVYVLVFSLILYQFNEMILKLPGLKGYGFFLFAINVGCLLLYWIMKFMAIRFLGFVFKTQITTREYLLNILIFCIISAIILLPLLVLIIYLKSVFFLYCSFAIVCLLFLFRFVKGYFIGITLTKFSYLFLFVYLCALEILPLVILFKLLVIYINSTAL